jgi:hypothetical protein
MPPRSRFALLVLGIGIGTFTQATNFDAAAYQRATIPQILEKHKSAECRRTQPGESIYSMYGHKYRIVANFSRELRPLSRETREFLAHYGRSVRWSKEVVEMYKNEFLVQEQGRDYWIPLQQQLVPEMGQELKKGQRFELYLVVIGSTGNRCMFIATEFDPMPKNP